MAQPGLPEAPVPSAEGEVGARGRGLREGGRRGGAEGGILEPEPGRLEGGIGIASRGVSALDGVAWTA